MKNYFTLNKLVNYKIRPDLYIILRIFELLMHPEINNTNLVKYLRLLLKNI